MLTFPFLLPFLQDVIDPHGAMGWAEVMPGHWGGVMLNVVLVVLEFCVLMPSLEVLGEGSG